LLAGAQLDLVEVYKMTQSIQEDPVEYAALHRGLLRDDNSLFDNFLSMMDEEMDEMGYEMSADMKSEMKAMIAYFDEFLKDLPEEKVIEFSDSPAFKLYKKLYKELGVKK
jgi:hypothetical protein